jgi:hypothetical protein
MRSKLKKRNKLPRTKKFVITTYASREEYFLRIKSALSNEFFCNPVRQWFYSLYRIFRSLCDFIIDHEKVLSVRWVFSLHFSIFLGQCVNKNLTSFSGTTNTVNSRTLNVYCTMGSRDFCTLTHFKLIWIAKKF